MTGRLLSDADLGEVLGATEQKVGEWRRAYGWPHVKVGRQVRYTDAHVEQIIAAHSKQGESEPTPAVGIPGQTARAGRRRSA